MKSNTAFLLGLAIGAVIVAAVLARRWIRARHHRRRIRERALLAESQWADAVDSRLQR